MDSNTSLTAGDRRRPMWRVISYTAAAAIDGQLYIKTMTDISLSWQQILDCS
jgi:hypothetical protein